MSTFIDYTAFKLQRTSYLVNSALTPHMRSILETARDEICTICPSQSRSFENPDCSPPESESEFGNLPKSLPSWKDLHRFIETNQDAQVLAKDIYGEVVESGLTEKTFCPKRNRFHRMIVADTIFL